MKLAVCLLVKLNDNYLVVNRPNSSMIGLVGGKVDPGENELQAIVREVKEEVGLSLNPDFLKKIFKDVCLGDVDYLTTTFSYPDLNEYDISQIKTESGLSYSLVSQDFLCNPKNTPFHNYLSKLFSNL